MYFRKERHEFWKKRKISWMLQKKNWQKSDGKPTLNPDLWSRLLALVAQHELRYHWVRGHEDNEYNNRCDALAVEERSKF